MTDKKPLLEILAPAGSPEQLEAGVRAGADAVYLGAGSLNARRSAKNFDGDALKNACAFCHERGVKVYLTVNTLVFDEESAELESIIISAADAGADAIIVQDLGVLACVRALLPDMPLFASTQMSIHTPAGIEAAAKLGIKRVILARELSLSEIKELSKTAVLCGVELESFVHGALCMSVSGQCYLSSVLGGRSGNRGRCAQPCRLNFSAGKREMCLSLRDMSYISHISELKDAGIASLKIEGRMKRPEYCAAAVTALRCARDGEEYPTGLEDKLSKVFSRQGFTDGYLTGKRGEPMFGYRTKDDVISGDSKLMSSLHELTRSEFRRVPVSMELTAKAGKALELRISDENGNCALSFGEVPLPSDKSSDESALRERLAKTGGTPYFAESVKCDVDKGLYLPASAVNAAKKGALAQLSARRSEAIKRELQADDFVYTPHELQGGEPPVSLIFSDAAQLPAAFPKAVDSVYLPLETNPGKLAEIKSNLEKQNIELALEAPRGCFGGEKAFISRLERAKELGINKIMAQNIGELLPIKNAGLNAVGGFGLNITNTRALREYEKLGLCETELSFELSLTKIAKLGTALKRGVLIYGRLPLMLTRNCPAALSGRCPGKPDNCFVTDRLGLDFPIRCRNGCAELFNSIPMSIVDRKREIGGVDRYFLRFTVENSVEIEEILEILKTGGKLGNTGSNPNFTRGLAYRTVE